MKKFRFTIARKLLLGFGFLTIAILVNTFFTFLTLSHNRKINEKIITVYAPSNDHLNELFNLITNSKLLIKNWVYIEQTPATPDKLKLQHLHQVEYPELDEKLRTISAKWDPDLRNEYKKLTATIKDTLFVYHAIVMNQLSDFDSYEDPMVLFEVQPMVEEGGEIMTSTNKALSRLARILERQNKIVSEAQINMMESFSRFQRNILLLGIILFVCVIIISALTINALVRPINYMKNVLLNMSKGIIPKEEIKQSSDEIGQMAVALNLLINSLKEISNFALEIGKGNFNTNFTPLSDKDTLGLSLLEMRNNLQQAKKEEEKRKKEEEQHSWASHGIAKFSDILRQNNNDINEMAYAFLSNLIKYIDGLQGGLFVVDEEEGNTVITMVACYAYDKRKYLQKKLFVGEGLIGRVVQEKEMLFLTDLPDDYLNISSGLGENKPQCLLIIPAIMNDEVFAVLELASFIIIEPYKIEFIQRLCESLASAIAGVKTTMKTSFLLEKTLQQAEEMKAQEEELRQNMEELQAAQEDVERKEIYLEGILNAIDNAIGTMEMDIEGNIIRANKLYLNITGTSENNLIGKNIRNFMDKKKAESEIFKKIWESLKNGIPHSGGHQYFFDGKEKWLYETFSPIKDESKTYSKIVCLSFDISRVRKIEKDMENYKNL